MKIEINLPEATVIRTVAGEPFKVEWSKVPANVVASLVEGGAAIILNNAFNGGGKDADEAAKLEQMRKRRDAWYAGEYVVSARGDSWMTRLREQYVDDMREQTGATAKQVEESIKALVADTFGEKEKASFARFLDALATAIAKEEKMDVDAARQQVVEQLEKRVAEVDAERAKKASKLDVKGLALAAFRKPAA